MILLVIVCWYWSAKRLLESNHWVENLAIFTPAITDNNNRADDQFIAFCLRRRLAKEEKKKQRAVDIEKERELMKADKEKRKAEREIELVEQKKQRQAVS